MRAVVTDAVAGAIAGPAALARTIVALGDVLDLRCVADAVVLSAAER